METEQPQLIKQQLEQQRYKFLTDSAFHAHLDKLATEKAPEVKAMLEVAKPDWGPCPEDTLKNISLDCCLFGNAFVSYAPGAGFLLWDPADIKIICRAETKELEYHYSISAALRRAVQLSRGRGEVALAIALGKSIVLARDNFVHLKPSDTSGWHPQKGD